MRPSAAFFDDVRRLRARVRFDGYGPLDLRVRIVRASSGNVIRTLDVPGVAPFEARTRHWNGLRADGAVPADGAYRVRVAPAGGGGGAGGDRFRFHGHRFPVRGPHGYGGSLQRFGAPRSDGRTHQGQDVYAACGTPLEAARGGSVQAKGYDPRLYGNYLVVDTRESHADHVYAHLRSPSPAQGRVRTGERVGRVGRTGNARTTPCHLHFEVWPHGRNRGAPVDPLPLLRAWDRWS
jgi:murein DD-endopeptidase MepM/ murein hydrolase activator NlpD